MSLVGYGRAQLEWIGIALTRPVVVDRDRVSQRRLPLWRKQGYSTASYKIAASVHTAASPAISAASHHSAVVASKFVFSWSSRACVKASSLTSRTVGRFTISCAVYFAGRLW